MKLLYLLIIMLLTLGSTSEGTVDNKPDAEIVLTGIKGEIYDSLSKEVPGPLFKELFKDPLFQIYEIRQKSESYQAVTVDYFKSPRFGLFTPAGKRAGTNFLEKYSEYLGRAVQRFELDQEAIPVISAMAGMEYSWGNLNPTHKIFNSLVSVYHNNPGRKAFVLQNINGLLQAMEHPDINIDPFAPSSFMGAAGYCQLMPFWFTTIIEHDKIHLLDLDNSGKFNPYSMPDAIAFFAWRLDEGGFNRDQRTAIRRYIGSGTTADSYVTAVLDFAQEISNKQLN